MSDNEEKFIIERSLAGGAWTPAGEVDADQTTFTDNLTQWFPSITFRVLAQIGGATSQPSNEVELTKPLIILIGGNNQSAAQGYGVKADAGVKAIADALAAPNGKFAADEIELYSCEADDPDNGVSARRDSLERVKSRIKQASDDAQEAGTTVPIVLIGYSWGGGLLKDALDEFNDDDPNNGVMPPNIIIRATIYIDAIEFGYGNQVWPDEQDLRDNKLLNAEEERPALSQLHWNYFQKIPNIRSVDNWGTGTETEGDPTKTFNYNMDVAGIANDWFDDDEDPVPAKNNSYTHTSIDNDPVVRRKVVQDVHNLFGR